MTPAKLAQQVKSIFSLPEIALRVNELLNTPEPDIAELEKLILDDPALTAMLLKIVNSAYFGFPGKIDTVSRAIVIIGLEALRNLVITVAVTTRFKGIPAELVDMDVFWYHSITRGALARILAKKLRHSDCERFFIAGLLSAIGKLVFFARYPDESRDILRLKNQGEAAMIAAEEKIHGFNYIELGAELLRQWQLPPSIWEIIAYQLEPLNSKGSKEDAAILNIAASLANSIEPCAKYDLDFDEPDPRLDTSVISFLELSPNLINHCIDEALAQAFDLMSIIHPEATVII
ncbi:MAG: phosphohydrolase [Gammaproteobacteria bacterium HGW-Gammaproteobacteria-3]|jgi:HD-like signal output (HDOD) protein|nr:MAG: phosphohydrolase [Gammaproteobacteria bacterium HGW-Gammaproteobacteria-3]